MKHKIETEITGYIHLYFHYRFTGVSDICLSAFTAQSYQLIDLSTRNIGNQSCLLQGQKKSIAKEKEKQKRMNLVSVALFVQNYLSIFSYQS